MSCKSKNLILSQIGEKLSMSRMLDEFNIHIASDGRWFHEGGEIRRKAIVKLFASVLTKDANGKYWLTTPVEKGEITVEDAPFIIVALNVLKSVGGGRPRLELVDNIERKYIAGAKHSIFFKKNNKQQEIPYVTLDKGLIAKISRPVYYQLMDMVIQNSEGDIGVWSAEEFLILQ